MPLDSGQEKGLAGKLVGSMIRRSMRQRFHTVYWEPPSRPIEAPTIFVPNHHGWHDGYLMLLAVERLGILTLDWIEEFDVFPLFRKVGGMPFPKNDPARRAATIRETIRRMKTEQASLLMFAERELHPGPDVWQFSEEFERVVRMLPAKTITPTAIGYSQAMHERPEAFVIFGDPLPADSTGPVVHEAVSSLLSQLFEKMKNPDRSGFEVLLAGTKDVNERWDMRRIPGLKSRKP